MPYPRVAIQARSNTAPSVSVRSESRAKPSNSSSVQHAISSCPRSRATNRPPHRPSYSPALIKHARVSLSLFHRDEIRLMLQKRYSTQSHAANELILHSDEYLDQQLANLEKNKQRHTVKRSSIAKSTKLITFLKWPEGTQNLGGIWACRVDALHSPIMMKLIEEEMQKRQCGLGLFQVLHEVDCLERTFLAEAGKTIPSYLLHYSILKPIKALREAPIRSDELLENNSENNDVQSILNNIVTSLPFKPKM